LDNLTHTLVGAVLGRAGLKRLSPRAMPALILSANLSDIDSFFARPLGYEALEAHRGFSHGLGGLVTLPFLAVAIIFAWEKLRPGKHGPLKLGGLLLACFVGVLSHDFLDYLTSYGTRLLDPLSQRWFYGDTLFILDPWIWIMLILGLEYSWRAERLSRNWRRPALWSLAALTGYIALNVAISLRAVAVTRPLVERVTRPQIIEAGEVPLTFWKRRMIWRGEGIGGTGTYDPLRGLNHAWLSPNIVPLNLDDPRLTAAAKRDKHVRAFLFWSRMPMVYEQSGHAYLTDQRFFQAGRASSSPFLIRLDKRASSS
jgi:inner membrane protein